MEGETVGGDVLLRNLKPKLIGILTADPDLVLQHTDSLELLTRRQYSDVKCIPKPSDEVRDLLDYVIQKGSSASWKFLRLLQEKEMQETFPRLIFLKELSQNEKTIGRPLYSIPISTLCHRIPHNVVDLIRLKLRCSSLCSIEMCLREKREAKRQQPMPVEECPAKQLRKNGEKYTVMAEKP